VAHDQLLNHQAGLNGLAETDVVGDEHPRSEAADDR